MADSTDLSWHIERLGPRHDRSRFACGQAPLDEFLKRFAGQYDKKDMGRTFVAVIPSSSTVMGYYTLAAGSVAFANLPDEVSRKLPRHPVPVAHLGRLAVNQSVRGQGLGAILLIDALHRSVRFADEIGTFGIEVVAIDGTARDFYRKFGFTSLIDDELHMYLPIKTVRKLFPPQQ